MGLNVMVRNLLVIGAVQALGGIPWLVTPANALDSGPVEMGVSVEQQEPATPPAVVEQPEPTFTIRRFVVEGSSLFSELELQEQLKGFTGRKKTADDVEKARDHLERYLQSKGYPTVIVNIPEQKIESREIRLQVIEVAIGQVSVTGNRYFATEKILRDLPSLTPGNVIQAQRVQSELNRLNRHPDFKVSPGIQPGKMAETVDVELNVTDTSPLHGSLELNNRNSHDTTSLRLLTTARHDNLWQREHSLSGQFQFTPADPAEVQIASVSYTMPTPWEFDQKLVLYGVWSNSETSFGSDNHSMGKGWVAGGRFIVPLPAAGNYNHSLVAGIDYKDFSDTVTVEDSASVKTPVSYAPVSLAYSGSLPHSGGSTSVNVALNVAFRGAVGTAQEFADKRYKARANYLYLTAGIQRMQPLPGGCTLQAKLDGQLADQPLISNEQYSAGGIDHTRGYRESEASGDDSAHGSFELQGPEFLKLVGAGDGHTLTPYLFYDAAGLWTKDPLDGQERVVDIQGVGAGCRGILFHHVEYQTDLGVALRDSSRTGAGDLVWYFKIRYTF